MNQDRLIRILDLCCSGVERSDFQPTAGVTHCNEFVNFVASGAGYNGFHGLLANEIVGVMATSTEFELIALEDAQGRANDGDLVIAGEQGNPHGHVCIIRPGLTSPAGFWGRQAPRVANVGGKNFIGLGLNFAFHDIPRIWAWKGASS